MLAHRWAANSQEDPDKTTRPPGQNTFAPDELEEKNTSKKDTERGVTKTLLKFLFQRFFWGGAILKGSPGKEAGVSSGFPSFNLWGGIFIHFLWVFTKLKTHHKTDFEWTQFNVHQAGYFHNPTG